MKELAQFRALAAIVGILVFGSASQGGETEAIVVRPAGGAGVTIDGPAGFGEWHLTFPENMLLDGAGRGRAKMSSSVTGDGTLVFEGRMEDEFAHEIRITYKPGQDFVDLTLDVTNLSDKKWQYGGEAMACLRPWKNPDFEGEVGRRTLESFEGKLQSVDDLAQQHKRTVGPKTTVSSPVRGEEMAPQQAAYHKGGWTLDDGLVLRQSRDKKKLVAFTWDRVHRVSMNFTYSCLHSNPRVTDLEPKANCRRTGRIYFVSTKTEEFLRRYRKDFGKKN